MLDLRLSDVPVGRGGPLDMSAVRRGMTYTRRLQIVLPWPLSATEVRETLEREARRRRRVLPCEHGETCVCRRSSTAARYGRTRTESYRVKVRLSPELDARLRELAARAGVPIAQAARSLLHA
jgi:hypothetical protein